jgi:hypothetical protein
MLFLSLAVAISFGQDRKSGGQERRGGEQGKGGEQRKGGGGRGGFGFFGGGGGFGGPGGTTSAAMLLAIPEVRKELSITPEQEGLLDDLRADLQKEMEGMFGNFGNFRELSDEERQKRGEEFRTKMADLTKKTDEAVKMVLDEKQMPRLQQLQVQQEGPSALLRAEIADKLGLSDDQKGKLAEIQKKSTPDMRGAFRQGQSREEIEKVMTEMRERREKARADMVAVLSPDQKEKWEAMQGKKFEFPRPEFRFGGRGGSGGREGGEPRKKKDGGQ